MFPDNKQNYRGEPSPRWVRDRRSLSKKVRERGEANSLFLMGGLRGEGALKNN